MSKDEYNPLASPASNLAKVDNKVKEGGLLSTKSSPEVLIAEALKGCDDKVDIFLAAVVSYLKENVTEDLNYIQSEVNACVEQYRTFLESKLQTDFKNSATKSSRESGKYSRDLKAALDDIWTES